MTSNLETEGSDVKDGPLSRNYWKIVKVANECDDEVAGIFSSGQKKCATIRKDASDHALRLYEKVLSKLRWGHPPVPSTLKKLVILQCEHYFGPDYDQPFELATDLEKWLHMGRYADTAKNVIEIDKLLRKIKVIVFTKEKNVQRTVTAYTNDVRSTIIRNDGKVRWLVHSKKSKRDQYWTIWYLSSVGMIDALGSYIDHNPDSIDKPDPDFGMTALHYACRKDRLDVIKYLLNRGASLETPDPEGRTCVHFTAQYGTRETLLEILGLGANHQAKDNFGCLPLDLARQNKNTQTTSVLQNWAHLLPELPSPPGAESVDESGFPEEFRSTPVEVLDKMSTRLRLLALRLDGNMDDVVSYTRSFGSVFGDENKVGEEKKKAPKKREICAATEMRLCEKHSLVCMEEKFEYEGLKSLRRRWSLAKQFVTMNSTQDPDEMTMVVHDEELQESRKKIERMRCEGASDAHQDDKGAGVEGVRQFEMGPNAATDVGRDLAETLIKLHFPGYALTVLQECRQIEGVEMMMRIQLAARVSEVALCVYDIASQSEKQWDLRGRPSAPCTDDFRLVLGVMTGDTTVQREFLPQISQTATTSPQSTNMNMNMQGRVSQYYTTHEETWRGTWGPGRSMVSLAKAPTRKNSRPMNSNGESGSPSRSARRSLRFSLSDEKSDADAAEYAREELETRREERRLNALRIGTSAADCAVRLHRELHSRDVVDPCTLAPLLEISAEWRERAGRIRDALHMLQEAELISSRTLGPSHKESVRLMLQGLKMLLKCGTAQCFSDIGVNAMEMSERLADLRVSYPVEADQMSREYANLIALARTSEKPQDVRKRKRALNIRTMKLIGP